MIEFLKHFTSKTRILLFGFILILIPGAIISYLSLLSINQKAENLQTKYKGTVSLVRDKLESEVFQNEANLRNRVSELLPESPNETDLKKWLLHIKSENPAFKNLFLVKTDGGLLSSSVSLRWNKTPGSFHIINPKAETIINLAEKAEFIRKNYSDAIRLYQNALDLTNSSGEQTLLLLRIGRCYFKNGNYEKGIRNYKKILEPGNEEVIVGGIPAPVIALSQIIDGYKSLKAEKEQFKASMELCQHLLDHPWDLDGGEYLYYLNAAFLEMWGSEVSGIISMEHKKDVGEMKTRKKMQRQ